MCLLAGIISALEGKYRMRRCQKHLGRGGAKLSIYYYEKSFKDWHMLSLANWDKWWFNIRTLMVGLTLRCRPVFRDGFLPTGFSTILKKDAPIGITGTSIRSVRTLTGEWMNTHTHTHTLMFQIFYFLVLSMMSNFSWVESKIWLFANFVKNFFIK